MTEIDIDYAVLTTVDEMPEAEEVRDLYAAAAIEPPLNETPQTAQVFADLFATALERNDIVAVSARRRGQLVAFAYGHPWRWEEQRDEWGNYLKSRLGAQTSAIDKTVALFLLARDPEVQRRGLGRIVLTARHHSIGVTPRRSERTPPIISEAHIRSHHRYRPSARRDSSKIAPPGQMDSSAHGAFQP